MKKSLLLFCLMFLSFACNNNKVEKYLDGLWVVESAFYNNESLVWDLDMNGFTLYDNHQCSLPYNDYIYVDSCMYGKWNFIDYNDSLFLKIETSNVLFNRNFKISNFKVIKESSRFYKCNMILESDSLRLICTKLL